MDGPREVRPEEIGGVIELLNDCFGFHRYDRDYEFAGLRRPVMQGGRAIVQEGRPVSYIFAHDAEFSIYGDRTRVSSIGCVCTREDQRNQGFAGTILRHHIERLAAENVRLMIVSGGRSLYRRHHCAPAGLAYRVRLPSESLPPAPPGLALRRVLLDEWTTLAPFYAAEPAHFIRPADLAQNLCFWWDTQRSTICLIEREGRPVAYAVLNAHRNREDGVWVGEYAGSRTALMEALPLFAEVGGAPIITIEPLRQDAELLYQCARRGLAGEWCTISGTIRIINLPGLMADLGDYVAARLPECDRSRLSFAQDGETCAFRLGDERVELDLSAAARLVCGSPDAPQIPGDLGRALSAIFPLPTISPGLNYV